MTLDFQRELLKFLVQAKESKKYVPHLELAMFDLQEHQLVFQLVQGYLKGYGNLPELPNLLEHLDQAAKKQKLEKQVLALLEKTCRSAFEPFKLELGQAREVVLMYAQFKKAKLMMSAYSERLKEGPSVFREMKSEMTRILGLEEVFSEGTGESAFLLRDFVPPSSGGHMVGMPTYLEGLNAMTAIGGFASPQLVVLMAAPKSFKTGNLINWAIPYVSGGKKVYYADCENGAGDIRARAYQRMMAATYPELMGREMDVPLARMVELYKLLGGDLYVADFPARKATVADIEADLERLRDEENWTADMVVVDYADLLRPTERDRGQDKRLDIQAVYFDLKNLCKRKGVWCLTVSQVNRNAVSKAVITMSDFAEDFGKAANCDAAFAICQTKAEKRAGVARIIPVAQRKGVEYTGSEVCFVEMDKERMVVREITGAEAMQRLEGGEQVENDAVADD